MRSAVFPCVGLGDALIALILSQNLHLRGDLVDTFHPFIGELQPLFPHLPFHRRPEDFGCLEKYDTLFFIYEKLDWMQGMLKHAQKHFPEKVVVLNPIATPNRDYPYWEEGRFDGTRPFVHNLAKYCQSQLGIEGACAGNGLTLPEGVIRQKYPRRVVIHPTSSRPGKNWSRGKFLKLSKKLQGLGLEPVFILTEGEKELWPEVESPRFQSLFELSCFIAESGGMIGNDSGIGHLASNVGLPTVTICRSPLSAAFWRPSWSEGQVVIPPRGIPNLKGMRLRDKRWQWFVPVSRVLRGCRQIHLAPQSGLFGSIFMLNCRRISNSMSIFTRK